MRPSSTNLMLDSNLSSAFKSLTLISVSLGGAQPPPLPHRWCERPGVRQPGPVVPGAARVVPTYNTESGGKFDLLKFIIFPNGQSGY